MFLEILFSLLSYHFKSFWSRSGKNLLKRFTSIHFEFATLSFPLKSTSSICLCCMFFPSTHFYSLCEFSISSLNEFPHLFRSPSLLSSKLISLKSVKLWKHWDGTSSWNNTWWVVVVKKFNIINAHIIEGAQNSKHVQAFMMKLSFLNPWKRHADVDGITELLLFKLVET
jgi:hypothetical protein